MAIIITCFYILQSKFKLDVYLKWIENFIKIKNVNIILYTNKHSYDFIENIIRNNSNIKVVFKEMQNFHCYKYKDFWIENHEKNYLLNDKISWKVNLLWNEKISFIYDALLNHSNDEWFIWCDIGYFRCENYGDLSVEEINKWPNVDKINILDTNKIYYAQVINNLNNIYKLSFSNYNKTQKIQIPPNQVSIAGGFFIIHKKMIKWWFNIYYNKVDHYIKNKYLIKDDQIIIIHSIFENFNHFKLVKENNEKKNKWFLFQRALL
jgi:hypothetical protein